ncbi:MAG: hypothetical protein ACRC8K_12810 [Waterburya sp.]
MTSSEEFKRAIRAGNINEAFLVAMSNAPELNITTRIVTTEKNTQQPQADNYLRTQINLIEGKIENEIGEQFTGDRYGEIKQFHIEQVTQGHQTIQHNLISLQRMFQLMSAFQQQQTTEHLNWVEIAADVNQESLPARPKVNQLSGNKTPDALTAGTTNNPTATTSIDKPEPQLPGFEPEAEDDVVDDLLSLADLDDQSETEVPEAEQGDWGEWLEEPEVKSEVFDLKSLNLRDPNQNWQNWDSQQHPANPQLSKEESHES